MKKLNLKTQCLIRLLLKNKIANYSIENLINKVAEIFGLENQLKMKEQLPKLTKISSKYKTNTLHKGKKYKRYRR